MVPPIRVVGWQILGRLHSPSVVLGGVKTDAGRVVVAGIFVLVGTLAAGAGRTAGALSDLLDDPVARSQTIARAPIIIEIRVIPGMGTETRDAVGPDVIGPALVFEKIVDVRLDGGIRGGQVAGKSARQLIK